MREKIKSLVLLILVFLSLFLTFQLWYGQQPAEVIADEDIYEQIIIEQPRPPEQIIFPETIAIAADSGYYILREGEQFYYRLWETLLALSNAAASSDNLVEVGNAEGAPILLTCYFKPFLPVGSDHFILTDLPEGDIERLELKTESGAFWLWLIGTDDEAKFITELTDEQSALLANMIADFIAEDHLIYRRLNSDLISAAVDQDLIINTPVFVPQEEVLLARLPVRSEIIDRDQLLKTFFIDYSLARTIEEKDGAVIYTDGEKGLRLTPRGFEFSFPRLEEGEANQTDVEALHNSGILISYHGGWPAGLRLENISQTRRGRAVSYSVQWRMYYQGYPIYAGKPIRAIFNDRGLIHFSRFIYTIHSAEPDMLEPRSAAEWQEALRAALNYYHQDNKARDDDIKLEAFNLGYAIVAGGNEIVAEPVWHLQLNDSKILMKADNLLQYKPEDLQ